MLCQMMLCCKMQVTATVRLATRARRAGVGQTLRRLHPPHQPSPKAIVKICAAQLEQSNTAEASNCTILQECCVSSDVGITPLLRLLRLGPFEKPRASWGKMARVRKEHTQERPQAPSLLVVCVGVGLSLAGLALLRWRRRTKRPAHEDPDVRTEAPEIRSDSEDDESTRWELKLERPSLLCCSCLQDLLLTHQWLAS